MSQEAEGTFNLSRTKESRVAFVREHRRTIAERVELIAACPECRGKGRYDVWFADDENGGETFELTCETCGGSGQRDDEETVSLVAAVLSEVACMYGLAVIEDPDIAGDTLIELVNDNGAELRAIEAGHPDGWNPAEVQAMGPL